MTDETFAGFEPANTTPVPDMLFDELLTELSGAELKVVLYIIRRTWGFKKETDAISFNQFLKGITTKDGRQLDKGCGIQNRTVLSKALADLEKRGYIKSTKGNDPRGDKATTLYGIRFRSDAKVVSKPYHPSEQGSIETVPPVVSKPYHGSNQNVPGVVRKPYPQETVLQDTDSQETVRQEESSTVSGETVALASSSPSKPIDFTEAQERKKATDEHKAITQEMLAEKVIAPKITLPSKQTPIPQSQAPGQPDVAPPASGGGTAPAGAGKKRTQEKQPVPEILPEAVRIMNNWDATRKKPAPRTKKHVDAALLLVPFNPSQEDLQACERWLYTTDRPGKPWYRLHGVSLSDIAENISKWQSLQDIPPTQQVAAGGTSIYTQASLDPERNKRNIERLKQKAAQHGHVL